MWASVCVCVCVCANEPSAELSCALSVAAGWWWSNLTDSEDRSTLSASETLREREREREGKRESTKTASGHHYLFSAWLCPCEGDSVKNRVFVRLLAVCVDVCVSVCSRMCAPVSRSKWARVHIRCSICWSPYNWLGDNYWARWHGRKGPSSTPSARVKAP